MHNIQEIIAMKRCKFILTYFIITILFNQSLKAQQFQSNTELGAIIGTSYYLGDLNTSHFNQSSTAAGLVIRENIDRRFVYKAQAMFLNIQSDERESDDTIALDRGLHFQSPVYEISGQLEFNFLPYQPGNPLYTWTPFIYTGLSIFNFNPKAENQNGEWVNLQELGTEGQGTTTYPQRNKYSLIQFAIPMGGGLKIAVNESFNILIEYGIRKTFTDYLDDVSTTYPGSSLVDMSNEAIYMSDPQGTHLKDDQRGDDTKKDWYSFAGITLSFKLDKRNDCPPY